MIANREEVRKLLQAFKFQELFNTIGWSQPPSTKPVKMTVEGVDYLRRSIAQMSGVMVYEIAPAGVGHPGVPDAKQRAAIHRVIEGLAHENLLIFLDDDRTRTKSLWYWVKREGSKRLPREHLYFRGQPGDLFLSKIDGMVIELDELRADGTISLVEVTARLADSLDVERVTKKFYDEFSRLRVEFIDQIEGIDHDADRFWYGSVLLNRLMFIYFLQKRGFMEGNTDYLDDKFAGRPAEDGYWFYAVFLPALFFEGFAKPEDQRSQPAQKLLGRIRYLNGGLFLRHALEIKYPGIRVPDAAFARLLGLFGRYSWHLDDTPGAADNAINPAVLGYIFEKYINQKAFGAYYTRTEITEYLCERTIYPVILDRVHAASSRRYASLGEALLDLDADLCRVLLAALPTVSVLDVACGSGAFLVAAMKALLDVYAAVFGKIELLSDLNLHQKLKEIRKDHPSLAYYMRKQIITHNLYGVDIMEEAVEIAKLRLFLALVSSAQSEEQLEPLPNIDFNIMAGNSLVGLLRVDGQRFDANHQGSLLQVSKAHSYRQLLEKKNRLVESYRNLSGPGYDLQDLRGQIDAHKREAYGVLNDLLLDDFQELGIQVEQAQAKGRPKKRAVTLADIEQLQPFHWGYEFDRVMGEDGGFSVIITNPPWEIFKPDAREFFLEYSDVISKKKMTPEQFEEKQQVLLQDPEILAAWLDYQSRFPHVSAYYRSAPQFANQISIVNGKKAGSDINLYKLFTEQCYNLLQQGGRCGILTPSGIYTDLGAKQLRELLFMTTRVDALFGFSNERFLFEGVHHSFKFAIAVFEKGQSTEYFEVAFRINPREAIGASQLSAFLSDKQQHMLLSVPLVRQLSPDSLSVIEFRSEKDAAIAEKMMRFPFLGEQIAGTWNLKLTSEFHMTNDSHLFRTAPGAGRRPLYEGKMISQFETNFAKPRYWVDEKQGRNALLGKVADMGQHLDYQSYRLAYRAIARSTDARTMIAAVLPANAYYGHSLNAVAGQLDYAVQLYILAVLNSLVYDYGLRQRVSANLTMFFIYQMPVPRLPAGDKVFDAIVARAARLTCTTPEFDGLAKAVGLGGWQAGVAEPVQRAQLRAELDARVAHLYGLSEEEYTHILNTFPLVSETVKVATLNAYRDLEKGVLK